jgi:fucose 4-O-acetylase-like acetyltransferase
VTKRSGYIDNTKGALLFLVVLCHLLANATRYSPVLKAVYVFFYTLHIPLFVFVSGYLSKSLKSRDTALLKFLALYLFVSMSTTLFSDAVYFIFSVREISPGLLAGQLLSMAKNCVFSTFLATGPSWYLLSMMIWRIITPYLQQRRMLAFSVIAAVLVGGVSQIEFAMSLSRTIVFFPFYLAGYLMDGASLTKLADFGSRWSVKLAAAAVLAGIFLLDYFYIDKISVQMLYAYSSYASCGYTFIHGAVWRGLILVSASVMSLCFLILVPRGRTVAAAWGASSMSIYIWHIFLMPVVAIAESMLNIGGWFSAVVLAVTAGACVLFSRPVFDRALQKIRNGVNRLIFGPASAEVVMK